MEKGARVVKSKVTGPCIIGEGAVVEDSSIGPYTSIGSGSRIINSHIESSVILEGVYVKGVARLEESLLGRNSRICRNGKGRIIKAHLGDYSELEV